MTGLQLATLGNDVGNAGQCMGNPADPALAAAHLVYALDRLGVIVVREPLDPARAARGEIPALHLRAASPRALAEIPPAMRAQLEQLRPALAQILEPSLLMTATLNRGAALVARHDPAWTQPGGIGICAICGRPTVWAWTEPAAGAAAGNHPPHPPQPLHPACVDPTDPGPALSRSCAAKAPPSPATPRPATPPAPPPQTAPEGPSRASTGPSSDPLEFLTLSDVA